MSGCGKGGDEAVGAGSDAIAVFRAPDKTVIARVGKTDVTVGDFRRRLDFECGIHRFTMQNSRHAPGKQEQYMRAYADRRARGILPQLVHCALLESYLESSCGGTAVEDSDRTVEKALRGLGPAARKLGLDGLAHEIGVDAGYLRKQALMQACEDKARITFDPASTNVTEVEIDEGLARLDAYKAFAVASNSVTWVSCSNALARVRAGADFTTVGREFGAEDTSESTEWATFDREELRDEPELAKWAFRAKAGDIGGPFDLTDGLAIVKVLERTEGAERDSMVAEKVAEVRLARINFTMIEEEPEPRTREYCRRALLLSKARAAQKRLFEKLFAETEITYPNGSKLDFRRKEKGENE